jgi:formate hydrogenlyase subunit 6/NADH:ubiquinone oxidoreductase subunit I
LCQQGINQWLQHQEIHKLRTGLQWHPSTNFLASRSPLQCVFMTLFCIICLMCQKICNEMWFVWDKQQHVFRNVNPEFFYWLSWALHKPQ